MDVYWEFADARLDVYRARMRSDRIVVSADPVLAQHRFTNTFRACDRVSQYLITDVIYDDVERTFVDEFARVMLFKLFNRIDTWEAIRREVGRIDAQAVLSEGLQECVGRLSSRQKMYSAAYIMPPPRHLDGPKAVRHVRLLAGLLRDGTVERIESAASLSDVYAVLRAVPSLGPFLAYQYAIDLCYGPTLDHDEDEFVVPGPGAIRGLKKCYSDPGDYNPTDLIRYTQEQMQSECDRLEVRVPELWGRTPKLIDLQNVFCEVDKYTRVARPDLSGDVAGSRIKQRYTPNGASLTAWFPPRWGINGRAKAWRQSHHADVGHPERSVIDASAPVTQLEFTL